MEELDLTCVLIAVKLQQHDLETWVMDVSVQLTLTRGLTLLLYYWYLL